MTPRNVNFIVRFISVKDNDNSTILGYRFEILYLGELVITDGFSYDDFDKCVTAFREYIISLFNHKSFEPMVVNF